MTRVRRILDKTKEMKKFVFVFGNRNEDQNGFQVHPSDVTAKGEIVG
jgi:hypothetical protein